MGIPAVQICAIVPIALSVGANRVVPGVAIPHPTGNPALSLEKETQVRIGLLEKALHALATPIATQTVFE